MKRKVLKYGALGIAIYIIASSIAIGLNMILATAGISALNTIGLTDITLTGTNVFAAGVLVTVINFILYRFGSE